MFLDLNMEYNTTQPIASNEAQGIGGDGYAKVYRVHYV